MLKMARKFEFHYTRLLRESPLTVEDLRSVIPHASSLRSSWGSEYIDFQHDEDVIYPNQGSIDVLSNPDIGIGFSTGACYSPEEFCHFLQEKEATEFTIIRCSDDIIQTQPGRIFHYVKITSYTDYPKMISDLEEKGVVTTFPSSNILCCDERKFSFVPGRIDGVEEIEGYQQSTFEVDSLGTSFWPELTDGVEKLWTRYLKVCPDDE